MARTPSWRDPIQIQMSWCAGLHVMRPTTVELPHYTVITKSMLFKQRSKRCKSKKSSEVIVNVSSSSYHYRRPRNSNLSLRCSKYLRRPLSSNSFIRRIFQCLHSQRGLVPRHDLDIVYAKATALTLWHDSTQSAAAEIRPRSIRT